MRSLSLALLFFCIALTVQQDPTEPPKNEILHQVLALASCIPMVNEIKVFMKEHELDKSNSEALHNMTILCDRATQCFASLQFQEADLFKQKMGESCEALRYVGHHKHCITGFFQEAYSLNESTCFNKYDFVEKDLSKKREAFEKGESCFTDYVKDHCNQTSIDFFSKKYQKFVNDISIKPNDTDYRNLHNVLNKFQCDALAQQVPIVIQELHEMKLKPNDTRVAKMNKMCKDMQHCVENSCFVKEHTKHTAEHACNLLEMIHKESFAACSSKLMKEKPDVSDYECLDGLDLYDQSPANSCKKATTKKECVKKIMEDKCGKNAVVDYDGIMERLVKFLDCE
ncbi:unnamed protein product [Caenorhabditis nigoni]